MRALLATLGLLALAGTASAEPVTYFMTGTLAHVDDGTGGTVDLTSHFVAGASFSTSITVERSTAATSPDGIAFLYFNPGTGLTVNVGSWQCTAAGATIAGVFNGLASPTPTDAFTYQASQLAAPAFGLIAASDFSVSLTDVDGTALSSGALPKPMPALSNWESTEFSVGFTDFSSAAQPVGYVIGTISASTTPAKGTTWGAVKGLYR